MNAPDSRYSTAEARSDQLVAMRGRQKLAFRNLLATGIVPTSGRRSLFWVSQNNQDAETVAPGAHHHYGAPRFRHQLKTTETGTCCLAKTPPLPLWERLCASRRTVEGPRRSSRSRRAGGAVRCLSKTDHSLNWKEELSLANSVGLNRAINPSTLR